MITLGLPHCIDDVLIPAMRQIGDWRAASHCSSAQEHLATTAIRSWIARTASLNPPPGRYPSVLLACGPGDGHTIGLEALALLLGRAGQPARVLPPPTAVATLYRDVQEYAAVVVVAHMSTTRRQAVSELNILASTSIPTFYAGNAFDSPPSRVRVPGTYLGTQISVASTRLLAVLDTHAPTRRHPVG